jgi:uncharacterized protein
MRIETSFVVPDEAGDAWRLLTDGERLVEWLGGRLDEPRDDRVSGRAQVAFGSLSVSYRGGVRVVERDAVAGRLVLSARGEDVDGRGRIQAEVALQLIRPTSSQVRGTLLTDLDVTGAPARMGGAAVESAVRRWTDQMAHRLAEELRADGARRRPRAAPRERREPIAASRSRVGQLIRPTPLAVVAAAGAALALLVVLARRLSRRRH